MATNIELEPSVLLTPFNKLHDMSAIAEGSFGIVYKARHEEFGTVAYKQLKTSYIDETDRLSREMRNEVLTYRLQHPNIVALVAVVFEPGNYGLLIEFAVHGSLEKFLADRQTSLVMKLQLCRDVAAGMEYLHARRPPVIHGDLKAKNVVIAEGYVAKICDFGLARWKEFTTTLGSCQSICGTVTHISPEIWQDVNRSRTIKCDVYAFGILLWEVLSESRPFGPASIQVIMVSVTRGQRPDMALVHRRRPVPSVVEKLIKSCWASNPDSRPLFEDVHSMLRNIVQMKELECPGAPPTPTVKDVTDTGCTLLFRPPTDCGGSPVTGYHVERRTVGTLFNGKWSRVNAEPVSEPSYRVDDLNEGDAYEFRVAAENRSGIGEFSAECRTMVAKSPWNRPGRPGRPTVVKVYGNLVIVDWTAPDSDGGSTIDGYVVEYRVAATATWMRYESEEKIASAGQTMIKYLADDTPYEFRVAAVNRAGVGQFSDRSEVIRTHIVMVAPEILEGLKSQSVGMSGTATFQVSLRSGEPQASVEWRKGGKVLKDDGSKYITTYGGCVATLQVTNCSISDNGEFKFVATNQMGSVSSAAILSVECGPAGTYYEFLSLSGSHESRAEIISRSHVSEIWPPPGGLGYEHLQGQRDVNREIQLTVKDGFEGRRGNSKAHEDSKTRAS